MRSTCKDIYTLSDEVINEYLISDAGNLIIIIGEGPESICFSNQYFQDIINERDNNIFFECRIENNRSSANRSKPYLKIPVNADGLNGFVPLNQIEYIINETSSPILHLRPSNDDDGVQIRIPFSTSLENLNGNDINVGSNRCQTGSSMLIYNIEECKGGCFSESVSDFRKQNTKTEMIPVVTEEVAKAEAKAVRRGLEQIRTPPRQRGKLGYSRG